MHVSLSPIPHLAQSALPTSALASVVLHTPILIVHLNMLKLLTATATMGSLFLFSGRGAPMPSPTEDAYPGMGWGSVPSRSVPYVPITYPKSGEVWLGATHHNVTWYALFSITSSFDLVSYVKFPFLFSLFANPPVCLSVCLSLSVQGYEKRS